MNQHRTRTSLAIVTVGAATVAHAMSSCAGSGVTYSQVESSVGSKCASCHNTQKFDSLLADLRALDNAQFGESNFPDDFFPSGLITKTSTALREAAEPAADREIEPNTAQRKAWIFHELHELETLLAEPTPPDYTSQERFDAFAKFGQDGAYEGCEIGEKLDLGHENDPEGMPPRWAKKLFELLGRPQADVTPDERQSIRDYVDGLLPGGLRACKPGEDSAS